MTSSNFVTLFDWDTVLSADSTEWCPLSPHKNIFVCGTYQIEKKEDEGPSEEVMSPSTSRHGRIYVFEVVNTQELLPHQVLELPAILDMKWCQSPFCGKTLLGVATASGELIIFELLESKNLERVEGACIIADSSKEVLALSLDWSCGKTLHDQSEQQEVTIVVSDSQGGVNLFQLSGNLKLTFLRRWLAHEYESWISAFNYWEPAVVYSGGDDCLLKAWDTRASDDSPIFTNRKHTAGVTSLQSNPLFEHILASGSYDELLRLWDLRKMKHPLHTLNLFGGVWRVKWDPFSSDSILTACMHGAFNVVDCKEALRASGQLLLSGTYKNHDSIAYGADWSHLDSNSVDVLVASSDEVLSLKAQGSQQVSLISTCSFYDHKLSVSVYSKSDN